MIKLDMLNKTISDVLENRSICHNYIHAKHVERLALKIAEYYPQADKTLVSITALLHDVWDYKFDNDPDYTKGVYKVHLLWMGLTEAEIDQVYSSIDTLSWSKGKTPECLEGQIVQDADRITAIGATGILRAATYSAIDGKEFDVTVQHLVDKCLLLKDSLNLPESKTMAEEGHEFLIRFIDLYKRESC